MKQLSAEKYQEKEEQKRINQSSLEETLQQVEMELDRARKHSEHTRIQLQRKKWHMISILLLAVTAFICCIFISADQLNMIDQLQEEHKQKIVDMKSNFTEQEQVYLISQNEYQKKQELIREKLITAYEYRLGNMTRIHREEIQNLRYRFNELRRNESRQYLEKMDQFEIRQLLFPVSDLMLADERNKGQMSTATEDESRKMKQYRNALYRVLDYDEVNVYDEKIQVIVRKARKERDRMRRTRKIQDEIRAEKEQQRLGKIQKAIILESSESGQRYAPNFPRFSFAMLDKTLSKDAYLVWKQTGNFDYVELERECFTCFLKKQSRSQNATYFGQMDKLRNEKQGRGTQIKDDGTLYEGYWDLGLQTKGRTIDVNGTMFIGDFRENLPHGKGVMTDINGTVYKGDFFQGLYEGDGTCAFSDNSKYEGTWRYGQFDGPGVMLYGNGIKYEGNWRHGIYDGEGSLIMPNGTKYEGQWKNGLPDGQGTKTYRFGNVYSGGWRNGLFDGQGIMEYQSGDSYDGLWKKGFYDGQGKKTFANGDMHNGKWKHGKRAGYGVMQLSNGTRFEGDWVQYVTDMGNEYTGFMEQGMATGFGMMFFEDGSSYRGVWVKGMRQGYGTSTEVDGTTYEGQWVAGSKKGDGTLYYSNGKKQYVGQWKADKQEGKGTSFFEWGSLERQYIGEWRNGSFDGQGTKFYTNGKPEYKGNFNEGDYWNHGVEYYRNGRKQYDGLWARGMRNGKGTWYQEAGWQYIGNWNDNKMTGEGILYQPDGKVRQKGNFNNGKCLNASDCKEFN